jgi:predicted dehydrogenase
MMEKVRVALVGAGGISQVVRIPLLKRMEDVELVALCDIDEAKASFIANKFKIKNVYDDIDYLLRKEKLDGIFICTPNHLHYPMVLAAIQQGVPALIEKPVALNAQQAKKIAQKAADAKVLVAIAMNNRFRRDAVILKNFLEQDELGSPFYVKAGWLKKWNRQPVETWLHDVKISGGGVIMDLGVQLIDLVLWLLGKPAIKSVQAFCYTLSSKKQAEDSALVVIQTMNQVTITVEVAWQLHMEKDMIYTNVFGRKGSALMNPLRLYKELHGNLVNVSPVHDEADVDIYMQEFEQEIRNFIDVIKGEAVPVTPIEDGIYIMEIIDMLYQSARQGKQLEFKI